VGIDNARRIYESARGFKSFVSLADADHLLTDKRDATYASDVICAWASRYVATDPDAEPESAPPAPPAGTVEVEEVDPPFTNRVRAGRHSWLADEPPSVGGADRGPTPYDHLLAALGTCTSMTLRMVASRKKWPLEGVTVRLKHDRIHASDCEDCESTEGMVDHIERNIEIRGDELTDEQRAALMEIADKCPVHRTLLNEIRIVTRSASR